MFECTHTLLKSLADLFTGPQIPLAGTFTLLTELTLRLEDTKSGNYTLTPKKEKDLYRCIYWLEKKVCGDRLTQMLSKEILVVENHL